MSGKGRGGGKGEERCEGRTKRAISTEEAPKPAGHYSQAILVGEHIYISGSGPFEPKAHKIVGKGIEAQTEQTLRNIEAILRAAGASLKDVVKITVYLRDMKDFEKMDRAYRRFFPQDPPARTTVQVGLYGKDRLIAMDAIAIKRS